MAHFAEIDSNNEVVRVLVVSNDDEDRGEDYLAVDLGLGGRWVQTSYNHNFRKQYAAIGFTYDADADVFIRPQPFRSWILDQNHEWQPPVIRPEIGSWLWNESLGAWEETSAND